VAYALVKLSVCVVFSESEFLMVGVGTAHNLWRCTAVQIVKLCLTFCCVTVVHVYIICCCFSKSRQPLVSQQALIPVVCQLDSSQSEAVVGSSSDVASPSRSRRMSSDIEDHSSPATSPEAEADSRMSVKRPTPRGLVDALTRYFTPSDKRRSRVSLNALPHASPRSLSSNSHTLTPAADTTHSDDTLTTMLPPKRRYLRKSAFAKHIFMKRGNATDLVGNKTCVHSSRGKDNSGDIQTRSLESPTSELSPGTCLPSESKPEVETNPACLDTSNEDSAKCERSDVTAAETSVGGKVRKSIDEKQRKRRRTQLSSLHDSLSHFFSAEGERKRTPVQYVDSDFSFETYPPFDHHLKRVKWQRSSSQPSQLESRHVTDRVEVIESSEAATAVSWPSTSYRPSAYHSAGYTLHANNYCNVNDDCDDSVKPSVL